MKFKVGPWVYTFVAVEEGRLIDPSTGDRIDARRFPTDREIRFDESLPLQRRLEAITRMCSDAWREHFGSAGSEAERDRRASSFTLDFWQQVESQGGIQKIAALNAAGVPTTPPNAETFNTAYAAECPCGQKIAVGSIKRGPARRDEAYGRLVSDCIADCPHCDIRLLWVEACNTFGKPTGVVLHGPITQRVSLSSVPGELQYVPAD